MTNGEDLEKELKRLGLRKEDLRLDKKPLVLDPANNIVDRVGPSPLLFFKSKITCQLARHRTLRMEE
jgi:hypothetical protein